MSLALIQPGLGRRKSRPSAIDLDEPIESQSDVDPSTSVNPCVTSPDPFASKLEQQTQELETWLASIKGQSGMALISRIVNSSKEANRYVYLTPRPPSQVFEASLAKILWGPGGREVTHAKRWAYGHIHLVVGEETSEALRSQIDGLGRAGLYRVEFVNSSCCNQAIQTLQYLLNQQNQTPHGIVAVSGGGGSATESNQIEGPSMHFTWNESSCLDEGMWLGMRKPQKRELSP